MYIAFKAALIDHMPAGTDREVLRWQFSQQAEKARNAIAQQLDLPSVKPHWAEPTGVDLIGRLKLDEVPGEGRGDRLRRMHDELDRLDPEALYGLPAVRRPLNATKGIIGDYPHAKRRSLGHKWRELTGESRAALTRKRVIVGLAIGGLAVSAVKLGMPLPYAGSMSKMYEAHEAGIKEAGLATIATLGSVALIADLIGNARLIGNASKKAAHGARVGASQAFGTAKRQTISVASRGRNLLHRSRQAMPRPFRKR